MIIGPSSIQTSPNDVKKSIPSIRAKDFTKFDLEIEECEDFELTW